MLSPTSTQKKQADIEQRKARKVLKDKTNAVDGAAATTSGKTKAKGKKGLVAI